MVVRDKPEDLKAKNNYGALISRALARRTATRRVFANKSTTFPDFSRRTRCVRRTTCGNRAHFRFRMAQRQGTTGETLSRSLRNFRIPPPPPSFFFLIAERFLINVKNTNFDFLIIARYSKSQCALILVELSDIVTLLINFEEPLNYFEFVK